MKVSPVFSKTAIPVLMAGLAFFLAYCQPKVPPEIKVEDAEPDLFAAAEGYREQGELEKALNSYQEFVQGHPRAARSALALDRMADMYQALEQPQNAITTLKRIEASYPAYASLPEVKYRIAALYFHKGQYQRSRDEALKWLKRYPGHLLEQDLYILLGDNARALDHNTQAFKWWLKAATIFPTTPQKATQLNERLLALIKDSGIETLEQMARVAADSSYAPPLYYKLGTLYVMGDDLTRAQKAVTALIQATDDPRWVSTGNHLLERIQQRLAVREGAVGCLLPLTGPFAVYGEAVMNGIALGYESLSPGQDRPGMEIVIRDTKGEPEETLDALKDLVEKEKVMAVIGPLSSKTAVAAAEEAQDLGVPIITLTHKQGIPQIGDMVFRHLLTPAQEIDGLLAGVMGQMGLDRYAILYPDNPYGRFCMTLFQDNLQERGGILTAIESYDPAQTDFAEPIQRLVHLNHPQPPSVRKKLARMRIPEKEEETFYSETPQPLIDFDAVFIPDSFQRVAMIAPQLAFYDVLGVRLLGTSPWQSPNLIKMAGEHVQEAIFTSGFFESSWDTDIHNFIVQYKDYFDAGPDALAATAYDTIRLLGEIMKGSDIRTRKALREALLSHGHFNGLTGRVYFGPEGEAHKKPILLTVSGGSFVRDPACTVRNQDPIN